MLALLLQQPAAFDSGPPESPLSWAPAEGAEEARPFAANGSIVAGAPRQPSSVSYVAFHDERPFDATENQAVWLAEYRDVTVPAPDGGAPPLVTLFLAVSPIDGAVAAFTRAAPVWVKSGWRSEDITRRAAQVWETFPADSTAPWQSTIVDVLGQVRRHCGVDPTQVGQIIIRPRQFLRKVTISDEKGNPIPQRKANGWLVEVLGTYADTNPRGGPMTIQVMVFRDGDLEFCGSLTL